MRSVLDRQPTYFRRSLASRAIWTLIFALPVAGPIGADESLCALGSLETTCTTPEDDGRGDALAVSETSGGLGEDSIGLVRDTSAGEDALSDLPPSDGLAPEPRSLAQTQPPAETSLAFTPSSLWKLYQGWIITLLVLVALQFALIVALLIQSVKRRQDRMALTETTQRFRLAGLAGQVGVWEWDLDADRMIIEPHLRNLLGYDAEYDDPKIADWRTHIYGEDLPKLVQAAHDHIHRRTPYFEIQHRMVDRHKNVRWFLSRGQAQQMHDSRRTRMVGTSIDITERKRSEDERMAAQEALQEKQAELAHLSRAATVGALSVALAHEINQPLTAILTNAQTARQLFKRPHVDPREVNEIMLDIENDGRRAGEVIQKLRNLLRRGDGDFERIRVESIVDEVLHLLRSELVERRITVTRTVASQPEPILGDSIQLQQVLLNLVNNATDAMRDVEPSARQLAISVSRTKTGWSRISVTDCGGGLSEHDRERLFQPFFTTKRNGLGLGLSISKSIVDAHAGRIWAESNRGGGTTFHVDVPAASESKLDQPLH